MTSNSFATKCRLFGGPFAKNNDPRSACVNKPTFTRILWHSTLISNSLAISRISSIKSSPSSKFSKYRRLLIEPRDIGERFCIMRHCQCKLTHKKSKETLSLYLLHTSLDCRRSARVLHRNGCGHVVRPSEKGINKKKQRRRTKRLACRMSGVSCESFQPLPQR